MEELFLHSKNVVLNFVGFRSISHFSKITDKRKTFYFSVIFVLNNR